MASKGVNELSASSFSALGPRMTSPPLHLTPQVDISAEEGLDLLNQPSAASPGYLTCDSRANSDYEETDAEGEPYTDHDLEEAYDAPALARSSEPTQRMPEQDLDERVAAALAYPIEQVRQTRDSIPLPNPSGLVFGKSPIPRAKVPAVSLVRCPKTIKNENETAILRLSRAY